MISKSDVIAESNLKAAFLNVCRRMDRTGKSKSLRGVDGCTLGDIEDDASAIIDRARTELVEEAPCLPAVESSISKDDGSTRVIYTYSIIDRIKASAIEQVVSPIFEQQFHRNLFSYREGKSSHDCARRVIRRYRRRLNEDFVFRSDVASYTDNIPQSLLRKKLEKVFTDESILRLLELFIGNSIAKGTTIQSPRIGLVQGVGLIGKFSNLYLSDLDYEVDPMVALYGRVGDDLFLMDKFESKIEAAADVLTRRINELGLRLNDKSYCGPASQEFSYLGYSFANGKIGIKENSVNRLLEYYRSRLNWLPLSEDEKLKRLRKIIISNRNEFHRMGVDFIYSHRFADDSNQIQEITNSFYQILTKFFFRKYSSVAQAKTKKLTHGLPIVSLTKIHYLLTHGKASYQSLRNPGPFAATPRGSRSKA